jgi:hypothetical protein
MKAFVLFVCCLLGATCLKAQTNVYHPFPDSANYFWGVKYSVYDQVCMCTLTQNYVDIMGDTITWNGLIYRIFNSSYYPYNRLIRQNISQKKVFALNYYTTPGDNDSIEYLLYDFSLNIGDSISIKVNHPFNGSVNLRNMQCTGLDSVYTSLGYRKRLKMEFSQLPYWSQFTSQNFDYWIEGIGSSFNIFYDIPPCLDFECLMGLGCFGKFTNNLNSGIEIYGIYCSDFLVTGIEKAVIPEHYNIVQNGKSLIVADNDNLSLLKFELIDLLGKSIVQSYNTNTVDISSVEQGFYIVRIHNSISQVSQKLFIH